MEKVVPLIGPSLLASLAFKNDHAVFANNAATELTGYTINELTGWSWENFVERFHLNDRPEIRALRGVKPKDDTIHSFRFFHRSKALRHVKISQREGSFEDQPVTILDLLDVTQVIQLAARQALTVQILGTLSLPHVPIGASLTEVLSHIRHALEIESVGIRIRADETFSLLGSRGPISLFLGPYRMNCEPSNEGKDCLCGKILRGELPILPCFSTRGSFITNDYPADIARIKGLAPLLSRNRCTRDGFSSIASIPIRSEGKTFGILHLASAIPDSFPKDSTPFLEGLGELIGLALLRQMTSEELHLATAAAQAQSRTKNEFLATMSHEIRSPMNAIIGFTELLSEAPLEGKYREYLSIVKRRGHDLLTFIDDVLDFARIEANNLPLLDEPFSLRECITSTVSQIEPRAEEKKLTLITTLDDGLPDVVRGDSRRVHQILINLLSNAVKLTATGEIRLSVKSAAPPKEGRLCVRFTLKDTGVGITTEALERMFEPITNVEPKFTHAHGGVNFGLHIVRYLVKKMEGEIRVESEVGRGTTFEFHLTFTLPESFTKVKSYKPLEAASPSMTILLADDDITSRILFGAMLRRDGHAVVEVTDGGMALVSVGNMDFDLVLMDVQMPIMDGLAATRAIRALKNHGKPILEKRSAVPIVALTAHALREDEDACLAAGMNGYLKKPLQADTLRACLRTYAKPKP